MPAWTTSQQKGTTYIWTESIHELAIREKLSFRQLYFATAASGEEGTDETSVPWQSAFARRREQCTKGDGGN